jgi:hypothetical protein
MRRLAPVAIGVAIAALLVSYVLYTQGVVRELRRESSRTAAILARI